MTTDADAIARDLAALRAGRLARLDLDGGLSLVVGMEVVGEADAQRPTEGAGTLCWSACVFGRDGAEVGALRLGDSKPAAARAALGIADGQGGAARASLHDHRSASACCSASPTTPPTSRTRTAAGTSAPPAPGRAFRG